MQDILLNCGMTPSSALQVDKGLDVSTGYACAGCKDHLSCPLIIKECECRREAGPVNPGPDLCSLQPGSIIKKMPGFFATKGHRRPPTALSCTRPRAQAVWPLCISTAVGQPSSSVYVLWGGGGTKQMDTSVRSGVGPPRPRPDHRCVSTLVPSHVGSAALCWSHAHSR